MTPPRKPRHDAAPEVVAATALVMLREEIRVAHEAIQSLRVEGKAVIAEIKDILKLREVVQDETREEILKEIAAELNILMKVLTEKLDEKVNAAEAAIVARFEDVAAEWLQTLLLNLSKKDLDVGFAHIHLSAQELQRGLHDGSKIPLHVDPF